MPTGSPRGGTLLLVEDDEPSIGLVTPKLTAMGVDCVVARSAAEARDLIGGGGVDLVLLDLFLPDIDGRGLLAAWRDDAETATIPVVIHTGGVGEGLTSECFALGADAFLAKPCAPGALGDTVLPLLERAEARRRAPHLDPLTGLLNRPGLAAAIASLEGGPRSLILGEVDPLSSVAGRAGWAAAEQATARVAEAIAAAFPGAVLARPAGDEFAVLRPGADPARAVADAQRMVEAVGTVLVPASGGSAAPMTAVTGVATDDGTTGSRAFLDVLRARTAPTGSAAAGTLAAGGTEGAQAGTDPTPRARPLVLIAEDDDIAAKILTHRLEKDDFTVLRFDNGEEAYRGALEVVPDLVILDVKMPGMDGFEILSRLRNEPSYDRTPIFMLTSLGAQSDVVRGFDLGADDYVLKPFSPVELVARIRRLLRRGQGRS